MARQLFGMIESPPFFAFHCVLPNGIIIISKLLAHDNDFPAF